MNAIKTRWYNCEIIANNLGLSKFQLYNGGLYTWILEQGWLEPCLNGDMDILTQVLVYWETELEKHQEKTREEIKIHNEKIEKRHRLKHKSKPKEEELNGLSIALWFIKKVGGVERARKLIEAAQAAKEILESDY